MVVEKPQPSAAPEMASSAVASVAPVADANSAAKARPTLGNQTQQVVNDKLATPTIVSDKPNVINQPVDFGVRSNNVSKAVVMRDRIRLDNFTLNQEKDRIRLRLPIGHGDDVHFTDVRPWGRLECDQGEWFLIPELPGEFWFNADYEDGAILRYDIVVNQDPRKLWLVKEPEDRTFEKPHIDTLAYDWNHCTVAGASKRGRSHEHSGSFRDDDMGVWADEATGRYVFIVADGAGSAKYSREGSRRAIQEVIAKLDGNLTVDLWNADGDVPPRDGQIAKKLCGLGLYANGKLKR